VKEFNIPVYQAMQIPEETYIDEGGRIHLGYWALVGFLEEYYGVSIGEDGEIDMDTIRNEINTPKKKYSQSIRSGV